MRPGWASVMFFFFLAFLGGFASASLGLEVATSTETCENQQYPPDWNPTCKDFVECKDLKTGEKYCQFDTIDPDFLTDRNDVPADELAREGNAAFEYRSDRLADRVCTSGTKCGATLADSDVASVTSTILVRTDRGTLLERLAP